MNDMGWLAVASGGLAMWMVVPPDGLARLRPAPVLRLPKWAEPLPEAMSSKKRWWTAGLVAAMVVMFGWSSTGWVVALGPLLLVGGWVGLGKLEPAGARRRRLETLYALPQGLDLVEACVRAGQPLRNAITIVADAMGPPVADLYQAVTNAISVGMSDAQAWQVLKDDPVIGFVARDLARSAAWGTTVTDVLAQHSKDLRRQVRVERLAAAKAVGVKSVLPLGMCYLPAFVLIGVVPAVAAGLANVLG